MTSTADAQDRYYAGVPMVPFDLVKELVVALVGVALLVVILAAAFSAPDVPAVTIASWAHADPVDFVTTATAELQGTSGTAGYGPPYNTTPDAAQAVGPIVPQEWAGVSTPIDTAQDFVLHPLALAATGNADLTTALECVQQCGRHPAAGVARCVYDCARVGHRRQRGGRRGVRRLRPGAGADGEPAGGRAHRRPRCAFSSKTGGSTRPT